MPNPHCHIGSVRPKAGGAHIKVIRPRSLAPKMVDDAIDIANKMSRIDGYVILTWRGTNVTCSKGDWARQPSIPPFLLPEFVAELARREMITSLDTLYHLERYGLIGPDNEGA